jgi:hypothetical protein
LCKVVWLQTRLRNHKIFLALYSHESY